MCEGLSGSTRSAASLYQRASISPGKSRYRTNTGLVLHMYGKRVYQDLDRFA